MKALDARATSTAWRERMLAGVPVSERRLEVDGVQTSLLEGGEGAPLVLLHGGIECGGVMWAPVLADLTRNYRVIVPDVPGLGESAPRRLDVDTFSRWLQALFVGLHLERPAVVAHSLVGSLTARAAIERGKLMDKLLIYAAPAVGPFRLPIGLRYVAIRFALRPSAANAERFERFALLDLDSTRRRDATWFAAFSEYTRSRAADTVVKRTMRQLISTETKRIDDRDLARLAIPISMVWGRHDRMAPVSVAEHAARTHGWPLEIVDHAAHAPHVEQPEAFVEALDRLGY
jgi:2-hydroxymuconate-semialdehyde hydrolase